MTEPVLPTSNDSPNKPRLSSGLLVLLFFPLLGLVVAVAMIVSEGGIPGIATAVPPTPAPVALPTSPPPMMQLNGEVAPDFELTAMDQSRVSLSDFRGRVVFLNFWATWCGPCEREMPTFEAFMASQPEDGPVVIGVNLGETYDAVKPYLDERGIHSFPILLDIEYRAGDLYGIGPIPVTHVIDENGMLRYSKFGEITLEDMESFLQALDAA